MTDKPWSRAIVVGASSGIGEAIARHLAKKHCMVGLVARRSDVLESICAEINETSDPCLAVPYTHDVRDTEGAEPLLQEIATEFGGLDLVVYCAGIMPEAGPEQYPTLDDIAAIETNLSGAVAWLNAAAYRFGRVRGGTIVGISSIAGERGRRGNPVYNATKAGFNVYLESLRVRLATRGVKVCTIKPGYVQTALIGQTPTALPAISADEAARQILEAASAGRRVTYIPGWWRWVALALNAIPAPIFERLPLP